MKYCLIKDRGDFTFIIFAIYILVSINQINRLHLLSWGHAVALLVEALCYGPEGREFDSRCGHVIFFFRFS
jgi:hypothetical protein